MVSTLPPARRAPPSAVPAELALAESIHGLMRAVLHRVQPTLERERLSMCRFWTLHLVSSLPEPTVSTVARHLSVRNPSACTTVDGLVGAGLVRRQRSEKDRRVVELVPTAEGRRAEAAVWRAIGSALRSATAPLPPEDVRTTARTLAVVAGSLGDGSVRSARGRGA